ncbi:MAG: DUF1385 domain-containing protein [Armatimonadota bacterium]
MSPTPTQQPSRWAIAGSIAVAFALGLGLFVALPTLVAGWLMPSAEKHSVIANVLEGGVRLAVILGYIAAISMLKHVRRVFQYHGAEHKVIHAFEHAVPLTVPDVARFSTAHPRCGTAFILIVVVVKMIVNCFLPWYSSIPLRLLVRLATLIPVASISYEITRLAGRFRDHPAVTILFAPGLLLQRLTTREPDADQIEVAIKAFEAVQQDQLAEGTPQPQPHAAA